MEPQRERLRQSHHSGACLGLGGQDKHGPAKDGEEKGRGGDWQQGKEQKRKGKRGGREEKEKGSRAEWLMKAAGRQWYEEEKVRNRG